MGHYRIIETGKSRGVGVVELRVMIYRRTCLFSMTVFTVAAIVNFAKAACAVRPVTVFYRTVFGFFYDAVDGTGSLKLVVMIRTHIFSRVFVFATFYTANTFF